MGKARHIEGAKKLGFVEEDILIDDRWLLIIFNKKIRFFIISS